MDTPHSHMLHSQTDTTKFVHKNLCRRSKNYPFSPTQLLGALLFRYAITENLCGRSSFVPLASLSAYGGLVFQCLFASQHYAGAGAAAVVAAAVVVGLSICS